MPSSTVCWGIELGSGALKALKLVREGDEVSVADFALIPHKRPLSDPDVDEQDAMRVALGTLVTQKDLSRTSIAISVPGHASFARFAKLPPVEPKKVPDLVKYEADQQIPFPIDEVEWDYQTFISEDEPDIEVGIFAVTRERVLERLSQWEDVKITPDCLSLSPVSVFNALAFDQHLTPDTPGTVLLDVGTIATDLIVIEAGRVWIRTFPMGGHAFTEAIASSFKLEYAKAEKLKREADSSKYKRQIFQAMRGSFADFGQDVQRSLQYYQQLHPDANLQRVIGVGSTFKLPGIRKVLSQQLRMDVSRCESFERLTIEGPEASSFQSVAMNMLTAYGLALQGLGLGTIDANLIPVRVTRQKAWKAKVPWFATAAVFSVLAGGASFVKPMMDSSSVAAAKQRVETQISTARNMGRSLRDAWEQHSAGESTSSLTANIQSLNRRRSIYSELMRDINAMLASADPQAELFNPGTRSVIAPKDWRFFELVSCDIEYRTPSGTSPKWTGTLPGATSSAESEDQDSQDEGARSGGGRPGDRGGSLGRGGRTSSSSRNRQNQPEDSFDESGSAADFGKLVVSLKVNSSNDGLQAFVDETILEWIRAHQDDPAKPYSISVPDISGVTISSVQTAVVETQRDPGKSTGTAGNSRTRRSTSSKSLGGSLGQIAPIGEYTAGFPATADVYQYQIQITLTLRDPAAEDEESSIMQEARR
jgi:type IV pilus assembly protein PilM